MIDLSTSSGNSKNKKIVDKELMKTLCVKKEGNYILKKLFFGECRV